MEGEPLGEESHFGRRKANFGTFLVMGGRVSVLGGN